MSTSSKLFLLFTTVAVVLFGITYALYAVDRPGLVQEMEPVTSPPVNVMTPADEYENDELDQAEGRNDAEAIASATNAPGTGSRTSSESVRAERSRALPATSVVRHGTRVWARLLSSLSSSTSFLGQSVLAETTEDIWSGDRLVLPAGTYVNGYVTAVKPFDLLSPARLDMEFHTIGGRDARLDLIVPATEFEAKQAYDFVMRNPGSLSGDIYLSEGIPVLLRFEGTYRMSGESKSDR